MERSEGCEKPRGAAAVRALKCIVSCGVTLQMKSAYPRFYRQTVHDLSCDIDMNNVHFAIGAGDSKLRSENEVNIVRGVEQELGNVTSWPLQRTLPPPVCG